MPSENIYRYITIDEQSITPKYLQLTNSIIKGINSGHIHQDYILPSINDISYELEISRDTAERAYRQLKKMGIIGSVPGKGYFIAKTEFNQPLKIFLLFNKLSAHKKIIYDAFAAMLGEKAAIDFYIYNNDFSLFRKLLSGKKEDYSHYVIIPHFIEGGEKVLEIINSIPKEKLLLLDKEIGGLTEEYASVYENFSKDIYEALQQASERLNKYHTIKIIFPKNSYYPIEIIDGFSRYCQDYAFAYKVINSIETEKINAGEAYITVMEDDLVTLIEQLMQLNLKAGEDIGIISYNETPIKKIILNGITTISTNFAEMGKMAAQLILQNRREHLEVPFKLTLRSSL